MKTAGLLIMAALIGLFMVSGATAGGMGKETPGPTVTQQATMPLSVNAGEYDLKTLIFDFPPGAAVPKHFHGGHVIASVIMGEITLREKGTERVLKAGMSTRLSTRVLLRPGSPSPFFFQRVPLSLP